MTDHERHPADAIRLGRATSSTTNRHGRWVPAIPEPLWTGFMMRTAQCHCGAKRRGRNARRQYREHYAYAHVMEYAHS